MNESEPHAELLISRHFDEALDAQEHGNLTEMLQKNPQTLQSFVATARVHAALESRAPAIPKAGKIHWLRWISTGVAVIAVLGWAGFSLRPGRSGWKATVVLEDMNSLPDGKPEKTKSPGLTKRIVKSPASSAGEADIDVQELLSRYYVNITPHGLTVPQALDALEEEIRSANFFRRPKLDQLDFKASSSQGEVDEEPVIFTPLTAPMPARNFLDICRLYGQVSEGKGGVHVFVNMRPSPPRDLTVLPEVIEWIVPPDFLSRENTRPPYPEGNAAAAVLARSYGVTLEVDESATFSSNPATLTLSARPAKLEMIKRRIAQAAAVSQKQIFMTAKMIRIPAGQLPQGFDENTGAVMKDAEFQQLMRKLSQAKEVNLMTAPSMILRLGQPGKIDLGYNFGEENSNAENVGLSLDMTAKPVGEFVKLEGLLDLGFLAGVAMPGELKKLDLSPVLNQAGERQVQHFATEYELWLQDRATGLFVADLPLEKGYKFLVCLTVTMIDPAGQPLDKNAAEPDKRLQNQHQTRARALPLSKTAGTVSGNALGDSVPPEAGSEAYPVAIRVEGKPGFVRSPFAPEDGMVDVTGISSGSKVKCPYTGKLFQVL